MTPPSDDADVRAQMAAAGAVPAPGMAPELMRELAPLLRAEGIDLGRVDASHIDEVNAAFGRAVERHNLALSTPTGVQRDNALAVLRVVAQEVAAGGDDRAHGLLSSVRPESSDARPTVAQVIGVAAGTLDEWLGRPPRTRLSGAKFPSWSAEARAAATDVLSRAAAGRAFDSLSELTARHGGRALLWGAALAVAVVVRVRSAREGTTADQLLPGGSVPEDDRFELFERWLRSHGSEAWAEEGQYLRFAQMEMSGLDLDDADSVGVNIMAFIVRDENEDDEVLDSIATVLYDYARFRAETAADRKQWEDVLLLVDNAGSEDLQPAMITVHDLDAAVRTSAAVPVAEKLAALAEVRPVAAVPSLLDWLGASRPVSQTGAVRRADIEVVAGMLGVQARGVTKRPRWDGSDSTQYVTSMREVRALDTWWDALSRAGVITVGSTRVRPGPAAAALDDVTAEMLVSRFVAQVLIAQKEWWLQGYNELMGTLLSLLDSDPLDSDGDRPAARDQWSLRLLVDMRIVGLDDDERMSLHPALHAPVARGMAMAYLDDAAYEARAAARHFPD